MSLSLSLRRRRATASSLISFAFAPSFAYLSATVAFVPSRVRAAVRCRTHSNILHSVGSVRGAIAVAAVRRNRQRRDVSRCSSAKIARADLTCRASYVSISRNERSSSLSRLSAYTISNRSRPYPYLASFLLLRDCASMRSAIAPPQHAFGSAQRRSGSARLCYESLALDAAKRVDESAQDLFELFVCVSV